MNMKMSGDAWRLFTGSLFNDAFSNSDCAKSNDRAKVNKELGAVFKVAVIWFSYYPIMLLEELRRITEILVRIIVPAEIRYDNLPGTNHNT